MHHIHVHTYMCTHLNMHSHIYTMHIQKLCTSLKNNIEKFILDNRKLLKFSKNRITISHTKNR